VPRSLRQTECRNRPRGRPQTRITQPGRNGGEHRYRPGPADLARIRCTLVRSPRILSCAHVKP